MSKIDPHDRIDLTGLRAGFGFQGGHMFTPEDHQLDPCDMTWWLPSLQHCTRVAADAEPSDVVYMSRGLSPR
jgi:hypothetical protein